MPPIVRHSYFRRPSADYDHPQPKRLSSICFPLALSFFTFTSFSPFHYSTSSIPCMACLQSTWTTQDSCKGKNVPEVCRRRRNSPQKSDVTSTVVCYNSFFLKGLFASPHSRILFRRWVLAWFLQRNSENNLTPRMRKHLYRLIVAWMEGIEPSG